MFEGKLPQVAGHGEFDSASAEGLDGDVLRALNWHDLVARLAAARDLRASYATSGAAHDASFDAGSARRIAAHHNGKHAINLEDSSNGKGAPAKAGRAAHGMPSGVARN
jgi:hypothetical protein